MSDEHPTTRRSVQTLQRAPGRRRTNAGKPTHSICPVHSLFICGSTWTLLRGRQLCSRGGALARCHPGASQRAVPPAPILVVRSAASGTRPSSSPGSSGASVNPDVVFGAEQCSTLSWLVCEVLGNASRGLGESRTTGRVGAVALFSIRCRERHRAPAQHRRTQPNGHSKRRCRAWKPSVAKMASYPRPLETLLARYQESVRRVELCPAGLAGAEARIRQRDKKVAGEPPLKLLDAVLETSEWWDHESLP